MNKLNLDIVIVGGGPVGSTLALALSKLPFKTLLIESRPWQTETNWDGRALALNYASYTFLNHLGVWERLNPHPSAIKTVHVSEKGRFGRVTFEAHELELPALGYVVHEPLLVSAIENALQSTIDTTKSSLTIFRPATVLHFERNAEESILTLKMNENLLSIHAKLVIAADGENSFIRKSAGIETEIENYHQTALVTQLSASHPTPTTAYERFTEKGTLALLPIDRQKQKLVITAKTEEINEWLQQSDEDFIAQVQLYFGSRVGRFSELKKRQSYPLKKITALKQQLPGLILLGSSAHLFHPIAAQGLNLSLQDTELLVSLLKTTNIESLKTIGETYEKERGPLQEKRIKLTDTILNIFTHPSVFIKHTRHFGLALLAFAPKLKKRIAKENCGLNSTQQ